MRIAYLAEYSACRMSGVIKKMLGQVRAWQRMGHAVTLVLVSPPCRGRSPSLNSAVRVFASRQTEVLSGSIKTYVNKILVSNPVREHIRQFNPDVIYYRDGLWYPGLERALSVAPYFIEINTVPGLELTGSKRWLYKATRRRLYARAAGVVAVTGEIADSVRQFNPRVYTSPNGIDIERTFQRVPPSNDKPKLVFVGSPGQRWHGVDKVLLLARELPEFSFHIIGPEQVPSSPPNVLFHGYVEGDKLSKLYTTADIGIGTLALHRKGMQEAAPLKVREYLAYGLPTIIAYDDPALRGLDCVLRLPNEEDLSRYADAIREFVNRWLGRPISYQEVARRIDISILEAEKLQVMERVLGVMRDANA